VLEQRGYRKQSTTKTEKLSLRFLSCQRQREQHTFDGKQMNSFSATHIAEKKSGLSGQAMVDRTGQKKCPSRAEPKKEKDKKEFEENGVGLLFNHTE